MILISRGALGCLSTCSYGWKDCPYASSILELSRSSNGSFGSAEQYFGGRAWILQARETNQLSSKDRQIAITTAVSKQKRRVKDKKRSAGGKQWTFDQLMLVWDDIFGKCCENASLSSTLYGIAKEGVQHYGRGCVLVHETVRTVPRGAASGFSFRSSRSLSSRANDLVEPPPFASLDWSAEYVPRDYMMDALKSSDNDLLATVPMEGSSIKLASPERVCSVLRWTDKTRLLGLLTDPSSEDSSAGHQDVGGEAPYDPIQQEMVLLLAIVVDGQQASGADVLKAIPANVEEVGVRPPFFKLQLRDSDQIRV